VRNPALLFLGSRSQVTKAQIAALTAHGGTEIVSLEGEAKENVEAALRAGRNVIVPILWQGPEEERQLTEVLALLSGPQPRYHGALRPCLPQEQGRGESTPEQLSAGGLALSGGDTAALVCGLLGAWGILLEGEVETGLPWGRLLGGAAEGMKVCTKAGGFGTESALINAVDFLSQAEEAVPARAQESA
jgi:uncharacterized protein YgbK (DUF1537 family)